MRGRGLGTGTPSRKPSALAPGFRRIYRRGRRAYRTARQEPSTENLHELRKRAKYLWYAAQIVRAAAPKKMKRIARRAHELSNLIRDDHDLALLAQRAHERCDRFADETSGGELAALVERRRAQLEREALDLGRRLFRKKSRKVAPAREVGRRGVVGGAQAGRKRRGLDGITGTLGHSEDFDVRNLGAA